MVALRPAEGDRPAPVVGNGHDRPLDAELVGQRAQILDPLFEPAGGPGPLGVPHVEMIDGDHSSAGRRLRQEATPQIGP